MRGGRYLKICVMITYGCARLGVRFTQASTAASPTLSRSEVEILEASLRAARGYGDPEQVGYTQAALQPPCLPSYLSPLFRGVVRVALKCAPHRAPPSISKSD